MLEQLVAMLVMATALGLDAFSASLSLGTLALSRLEKLKISAVIGLFHLVMPCLGIVFGSFVSQYFGLFTTWIAGSVLLLLGLHMFLASFSKQPPSLKKPYGFALMLFAVTVSFDSFSLGISLGMLNVSTLFTIVTFGAVALFLSWIGLHVGEVLTRFFGRQSERLGGMILIAFGLKIIF